jgi:non-ribosomal peptide synthetase component E (peptide arylation enzyme)
MAEPDAACSELLCRHPYGYLGYLDDAGQWLYRTAPSDWYRTGDLVEAIPPEGFAVKGRANDSINRSGYLVMLNDIENAMEKLADLTQVAVVAADHREDQRGPRLTAFCAIKRNAVLDAAGIRAACFELLPHYAIPDRVVVIDALPLLPSGKVDRQALAAHAVQA